MKLTGIIGTASVVALMTVATVAHADIITATWIGSITSITGTTSTLGSVYYNESVAAVFTFDTASLSGSGIQLTSGNPTTYETGEGLFSDITIAVGGGPEVDVTSLLSDASLGSQDIRIGEAVPNTTSDLYLDQAQNNATESDLYALFFDNVGGVITTLDPSQPFSVALDSDDRGSIIFTEGTGVVGATLTSVTVSDESSVPAPGALALLGLGLAGLGVVQRRKPNAIV